MKFYLVKPLLCKDCDENVWINVDMVSRIEQNGCSLFFHMGDHEYFQEYGSEECCKEVIDKLNET